MTIVAFLQNQWFKNPERVALLYAQHANDPGRRAKLNARFLFYRSVTGKRLLNALGQDACDAIVWEEASREVGSVSSHCPPADPQHIRAVIEHFKPSIVLAFGRIAQAGVLEANQISEGVAFKLLCGPHPAARHPSASTELLKLGAEVRNYLYRSLTNAQ